MAECRPANSSSSGPAHQEVPGERHASLPCTATFLAARAEFGVTSWFALDPPPTVERIQQACMLNDFGAP
jgi:hypothetical protein